MYRILLLFLLTGFSSSQAQENYNTKNLQVSEEDLHGSTFSNDSTANSFYIFEKGYSQFEDEGNYNLITDYSAKIKILNKEGYDHAKVEIRLHKSKLGYEKIHNLKATTYFLDNGKKKWMKLDASNIYTEKNESYDIVKFTFPSISPGAVLVYSYQKESPFFFNFQTWWFQEDIPKLYSSYETSIPANYLYNIKKIGELKLDVNTSKIKSRCFQPIESATPGDCILSEYTMKNIPAFIEEPYLTSKFNFVARIEYELMQVTNLDGMVKNYTKTWRDVDHELKTNRNIGRQLNRTSIVKDILPEPLQLKPNNLSKAKDIFDFIKENYSWNGEYKIYNEMNLKDVINDKSGNVSSINILMHNIFEKEGFKVLPVMISTRSNGFPTKLYPVLSEFNYLMVQLEVEGEKYLLDATEKNISFGEIPFRGLNQYARLLDFNNESSWIDIEPSAFSGIVVMDSLKVSTDGTSNGISEHIFKGYHALQARNSLENLRQDEIFNELSNPSSFTRSGAIILKNQKEVSEALHIKYNLNNQIQKINNTIFLNPFSFRFFKRNPFQLESRHYPIDFGYKDAYSYIINIEIPKNFKFEEFPEQKLLRLPESGGTLQFFIRQNNDTNLDVFCRISFPKAFYSSAYYPYLKDFFDAIIEVQTQSLIVIQEIT